MDRGDGRRDNPIQRGAVDELVFELQQRPDFEEIRPMVRWLEFGLLRGLLTEENLRVLGQVIHQVQQDDEEEDRVQDNDEEADNEEEEQADVPVAGIEINPPQVEGPWVHNREEIPAGEMEMHPAQQVEDPIAEEMMWFWDDEEDESDNESVSESGPDSDTDDNDTDNNNNDNNDTDENDDDDGGEYVQDAPVPLPPSPVPGGSRSRPREEEDDEEENGAPRKQLKL